MVSEIQNKLVYFYREMPPNLFNQIKFYIFHLPLHSPFTTFVKMLKCIVNVLVNDTVSTCRHLLRCFHDCGGCYPLFHGG